MKVVRLSALRTGRLYPPGHFFYWHNPPGLTMALGSTQPLTDINTGLFLYIGRLYLTVYYFNVYCISRDSASYLAGAGITCDQVWKTHSSKWLMYVVMYTQRQVSSICLFVWLSGTPVRVKCRKHVGNKQWKLCGCTVASTCIGQCRLIAEHCGLRLPVIQATSNVSFSQNIQHYNLSPAAVFSGCVTCSVPLREEYVQWVIESRSEEEEITGGWRRLCC